MSSILITGGLGYIGSHIAFLFAQLGYHVIIVDQAPLLPESVVGNLTPLTLPTRRNSKSEVGSLSSAHIPNVAHIEPVEICSPITFITADYGDKEVLENLSKQCTIDAVVHCAGYIEVGESVKDPDKYYDNNVSKTRVLLSWMVKNSIKKIIFSSSCAVYGIPEKIPLDEHHVKNPISPYGRTKFIIELMLQDYTAAYGINYVALRYFNAAGAWPEYNLGERHEPESHIIPLALKAAYSGKQFTIFGTDYDTYDGTCIRDYLHVRDLAQAHVEAYNYLSNSSSSIALNLGTGTGYSVQQILETIEKVTGKIIDKKYSTRRAGDPAILIADPSKAQKNLNWTPHYSNLATIISSAHEFYSTEQN